MKSAEPSVSNWKIYSAYWAVRLLEDGFIRKWRIVMWFWAISAITGSILGNATDSWFSQTKLGMWFYKKVDDVSTWDLLRNWV